MTTIVAVDNTTGINGVDGVGFWVSTLKGVSPSATIVHANGDESGIGSTNWMEQFGLSDSVRAYDNATNISFVNSAERFTFTATGISGKLVKVIENVPEEESGGTTGQQIWF